ncbi:MAG: hypothetical protein AAGA64_17545 [Bacteroidota bacterium]
MGLSFLMLFILYFYQRINAQKQANNWHFGDSASVSYSTNFPLTMFNSAMSASGVSVSYSDPATGELLFYSNG